MPDVFVTLELDFRPGAADSIVGNLAGILQETAHQPGFVATRVHRDPADPEHLILVGTWRSASDYRAYFQWRTDTGLIGQITAMLTREPRLTIWGPPVCDVTV